MIYSPSGYVYRLVKVSDCSGNRDKPLIRKGNRKEARCAGNILIHIYIYEYSSNNGHGSFRGGSGHMEGGVVCKRFDPARVIRAYMALNITIRQPGRCKGERARE